IGDTITLNHQATLLNNKIVKMSNMILFLVVVLFSTTLTSHSVDGCDITLKEDFELERHLKLINKPPIKSIETEFGYIVDCVDIKKQPALDHPLLKNHKLQTRPSIFSKNEKTNLNISPTKTRFGLDIVNCPKGSVPIRRTTKEELIRAKSLLENNTLAKRDAHKAEVYLKNFHGENYYGVSGTTSVYKPECTIEQASASNAYVRNGEGGAINEISVGWHVFPHIYGNDRTYAYATWTSDNYVKTGCYNVQCQGFVQIHSQYHIGAAMQNTSVYGGDTFTMSINIYQDAKSKNWWISIFGNTIGYYPQELFNNLKEAVQVGWGGATIAIGAPSPKMGSGYFPDGNFKHACYFQNIGYKNATNSQYYGPDYSAAKVFHDVPECFGVDYYGRHESPFGYCLQFGGPGGKCD
ncbi:protein neprosin-like, partial [Vicia villosa]|uniref:protein neprosin-like n=1 Tax=Vicia villosa TaxID=3911 RepID=UPI00273BE6D0